MSGSQNQVNNNSERAIQLAVLSEFLEQNFTMNSVDAEIALDEFIGRLETVNVVIHGHGPTLFYNFKNYTYMTFYINDGILNLEFPFYSFFMYLGHTKTDLKTALRTLMKKHYNIKKISYFCFPNGKQEW